MNQSNYREDYGEQRTFNTTCITKAICQECITQVPRRAQFFFLQVRGTHLECFFLLKKQAI
jgi:hypothetical protein